MGNCKGTPRKNSKVISADIGEPSHLNNLLGKNVPMMYMTPMSTESRFSSQLSISDLQELDAKVHILSKKDK